MKYPLLDNIEAALRDGRLQVLAANGKWYSVRRNGKTKTWKRDPHRWEIPLKWAFSNHATITDRNAVQPNLFGILQRDPTV
jgi:hypothetical protein